MIENHQKLVEQYKEFGKAINKAQTKTVILEITVVAIVCGMKAVQKSASLNLNLIASACVTFFVIWHFWDFKYRRALDRRKTAIVIEGIEIERQSPFLKLSFFQDFLKKFNVIGALGCLAVFDFAFLYFFSVSITQLLRAIDPEIVSKLAPSTPIRTFIIGAFLGIAYYRPIRALAHLKKELEGSWV